MSSANDRKMSVVGDLLEYARVKRAAALLAKGECDVLAHSRLMKEAALMEVAANLIDASHESQAWKINP